MTKIATIVICIIVVIGIVVLLAWMAKVEHDFNKHDYKTNDSRK